MTFLVVSSSFSCQMMTEQMKRPLNAKMERFSFNGRFFGNDHGMTNFSFHHHSVAKRARTKEDGMKKVGWFSMGKLLLFQFLGRTRLKHRESGEGEAGPWKQTEDSCISVKYPS